jgi:hypothetical protein
MGTTHEAGPGEAPVRFCKLASVSFAARATVQQVEEGLDLAPRFDGAACWPRSRPMLIPGKCLWSVPWTPRRFG